MERSDDYFAGLFDGEGCVSMSLCKKGHISIAVKVQMCDRAPIEALHRRFGGRLEIEKRRTRNDRPIHAWSLFNAQCVEALEVFVDLCLVKQHVAAAALPVARSMRDNPTRGVLSSEEKAARIAAAQIIAKFNTPGGKRRVLDPELVAAYMAPKTMGGGKRVRLSDGREFHSKQAAGRALGVTGTSVANALKNGTRVRGFTVETC